MQPPANILITGASSGIGAALAGLYARPGVTLGLLGRDAVRLFRVAADCTMQGAHVQTGLVDVCDRDAMREWVQRFDAAHHIDLIIANAGIAAGLAGQGETEEQVRDIFAVNVGGTLNTVLPVIPLMQARGRGQIALMSSLAGIRGLPSCPAYSASKNAVRAWGEGLRGGLKKDGVTVSVICPGFIKTPLTDSNRFPMPLIMSPERAASIIVRGLNSGRGRIAFPSLLYIPLYLLSCLSTAITDPLFAALPKKGAQ